MPSAPKYSFHWRLKSPVSRPDKFPMKIVGDFSLEESIESVNEKGTFQEVEKLSKNEKLLQHFDALFANLLQQTVKMSKTSKDGKEFTEAVQLLKYPLIFVICLVSLAMKLTFYWTFLQIFWIPKT